MDDNKVLKIFLAIAFGLILLITVAFIRLTSRENIPHDVHNEQSSLSTKPVWKCPDESTIPKEDIEQIKYGRDLIKNTSLYLGPKGTVARISNGMNCQNCHLDAGTKPWGNNYFAVFSTYPKYRERSGNYESMAKRINDCFERSLNGKALDSNSKEMKAIIAYMKWLGTGVEKGVKPEGAGVMDLDFLNVAASPTKGKSLYELKCQSCHKLEGDGILNADGKSYLYPPLWGANSYNTGAALFRISVLAGYIKNNMPQGSTFKNPQLTDEEAWDIAAFLSSMARPKMNLNKDWPRLDSKPIDYPFGPYADGFSEFQHKYGPFAPIKKAREADKKKTN